MFKHPLAAPTFLCLVCVVLGVVGITVPVAIDPDGKRAALVELTKAAQAFAAMASFGLAVCVFLWVISSLE